MVARRETGKSSLWQPCVWVNDKGTIEIDWSSSFVYTYDHDAEEVVPYAEQDEPGERHNAILNAAQGVSPETKWSDLTQVDQARMLRNLANAIEETNR